MAKKARYEYKVGEFVRVLPNYAEINGESHQDIDDAISGKKENRFSVYEGGKNSVALNVVNEDGDDDYWYLSTKSCKPWSTKKTLIIYGLSERDSKEVSGV